MSSAAWLICGSLRISQSVDPKIARPADDGETGAA
jgi:hypothetical protein